MNIFVIQLLFDTLAPLTKNSFEAIKQHFPSVFLQIFVDFISRFCQRHVSFLLPPPGVWGAGEGGAGGRVRGSVFCRQVFGELAEGRV